MSPSAWGLLALFLVLLLALSWPLGIWVARLCAGKLPRWMHAVEAPLYRLAGTSPDQPMNWLQYAMALLAFNALGVLAVYLLQRFQAVLPLNPAGMAAVSPDSAFNTAISFVTNTNWQGYAGESTMSYLTQMLALAVQNFFSAATAIGVVFALIRGFAARSSGVVGNFWVDVTRVTDSTVAGVRAVPGERRRDPELRRLQGRDHAGGQCLPAAQERPGRPAAEGRQGQSGDGGHEGGDADAGHGPGGLAGGDQDAGHQRRRLLQREFGTPL
jgi:hypothetical protein